MISFTSLFYSTMVGKFSFTNFSNMRIRPNQTRQKQEIAMKLEILT